MRVFEDMSFEKTGRVFDALMSYAFDGDEPESLDTPEERAAFYALAASIDVAAEKYGVTNK